MFRKPHEVAKTQKCLKDRQIESIYVDEFTVNTRHSQFKGWVRKMSKDGWKSTNQAL